MTDPPSLKNQRRLLWGITAAIAAIILLAVCVFHRPFFHEGRLWITFPAQIDFGECDIRADSEETAKKIATLSFTFHPSRDTAVSVTGTGETFFDSTEGNYAGTVRTELQGCVYETFPGGEVCFPFDRDDFYVQIVKEIADRLGPDAVFETHVLIDGNLAFHFQRTKCDFKSFERKPTLP